MAEMAIFHSLYRFCYHFQKFPDFFLGFTSRHKRIFSKHFCGLVNKIWKFCKVTATTGENPGNESKICMTKWYSTRICMLPIEIMHLGLLLQPVRKQRMVRSTCWSFDNLGLVTPCPRWAAVLYINIDIPMCGFHCDISWLSCPSLQWNQFKISKSKWN